MTQANGRDPRDGGALDGHQIADTLWKSYPDLAIMRAHAQINCYHNATLSIFGQESHPITPRVAHLNLAIQGIKAKLGPAPADTFLRDQRPDPKAEFVLADPPFNVSTRSA
jgi:type I restriction-modification system DNA methylase subunit